MQHVTRTPGRIIAAGVLAAPALLLAVAGLSGVSAQPPAYPVGELAGQSKNFKNIKVLKKLPSAQLIPTMRAWNAALGVKCDFCHTIGADHKGFDRDDKPEKQTARVMLLMVNDLNKHQKPLNNRANCYLCHHGHANPESRPAPEEPRDSGAR